MQLQGEILVREVVSERGFCSEASSDGALAAEGQKEAYPLTDMALFLPFQVRRREAACRAHSAPRNVPAWTPWSDAATSTSRPCPRASPRTSQSCK